jgi:hypothetical protein
LRAALKNDGVSIRGGSGATSQIYPARVVPMLAQRIAVGDR